MTLEQELEELEEKGQGYSIEACEVQRDIRLRDSDYQFFLTHNGEAIGQCDGMQLVRWAFNRGWEAARQ